MPTFTLQEREIRLQRPPRSAFGDVCRDIFIGVMVTLGALLLLGLLTTPVKAAAMIAPDNRVQNEKAPNPGYCWFACAEMIGRELGIVPLQNLVGLVTLRENHGHGYPGGAGREEVDFWLKRLHLRAAHQPEVETDKPVYKRTTKDHTILTDYVGKHLPIIVGVQEWDGRPGGAHAILLLDISDKVEKWNDGTEDYGVFYLDPNFKEPKWTTWTFFYSHWTNEAYVFDPKEQDPKLIEERPLRPGRLMLDGKFKKEAVKVTVVKRPPIVVPSPFVSPHQLPFGPTLYPKGEPTQVKIPSNQDIKDGVTRPDDTLHVPAVAPSYDYQSKFNQRKP